VSRHVLKILFASPLIMLIVLTIYINITVYNRPDFTTINGVEINAGLLNELRGLKKSMQKGADVEMQEYYPEGYVFMNSIYGLAWADFLESTKNDTILFNEGYKEIQLSWEKINSDVGHGHFDEDLPLPFGAFYCGWNNYLLGRKLSLELPGARSESEVSLFTQQCDKIAYAIEESVYPVSYSGGAWPADVMVAVASLQLHDNLFEKVYQDVITRWLTKVKNNLDSNGLIPHSVHPVDGRPNETARGSSQCLMLILLKDIDPEFAMQQFLLFKGHFVDDRFGLTGIYEYPKGESGTGDVDSGPVILGFGGAATIVGMRTLSTFDDHDGDRIMSLVGSLGFPITTEGRKTYFFGQLPMADAFIAWSHGGTRIDKPRVASYGAFHLYKLVC
jgi:hypothetical protein